MEEIVTKAMRTVTDGLKESEKMHAQLEERHMEFEEKMKEKSIDFQKEMMKLLVSRLAPTQYAMYQPYPQQQRYFNPNDGL